MSALGNYLENALANHVLRNTPYTSPGTSVYIALHTADPGEDGSGAEVSGNNYSRVQCTAWDAPNDGMVANTNAITFPAASGSWGTVTHMAIWDAATSGNLLFHAPLQVSKAITTNDVFSFPAGSLTVTFA